MRTLQEKYNAIQEGNFSKEHFLTEARMQQPQLITRFNGYDDAVQILKNRGMIQEAKKQEGRKVTDHPFIVYTDKQGKHHIEEKNYEDDQKAFLKTIPDTWDVYETRKEAAAEKQRRMEKESVNENYSRVLGLPDGNYFAIDGDWEDEYQGKSGLFFTVKGNSIYDKDGQAIQSSPREFISQFTPEEIIKVETVNEAKQTKLTKKSLTDYRYKPTNDMDKYPYEQILRGLRVELEAVGVQGTPTPEEYSKALAKVSKNLAKDSIFYTNQLAGHNKKVDLHDKFVDATAKNTVDTFNGMKKIKDLKESHTGNPKDKYVVRPCKNKKEPWAVWEGEERVKGFATKEQAKEYADKQNKKQGLSESVLKEGIKNLIKKALMENEEDIYEMQGPKTDGEYKSELADYLEDNQIYGYTGRIHDIMTGPDENTAAQELEAYLEDNQIYGRTYLTSILDIYSDYPYDEHWMNQPDEDEAEELPKEIPGFEGTRDALDDLFEAEDKEADKAMVRRLMAMYETEPSKFEKLYKQAQVQAATTKDIKFKHLLSLINRAKAGALQSLANQDRFEADREGINEESDDDKLARYRSYTYTLDGEVVSPKIGYYNNYIGAELDGEFLKVGIPSEDGVVQLRYPQGKQGMYTENIFKSVSLKDIL